MNNEQEKTMKVVEMINVLSKAELKSNGDYANVEIYDKDFEKWMLCPAPSWNFNVNKYRIKPETKTSRIPLSREDILDRSKLGFEAMWITDNGKDYSLIVGISHDGVYRRTGFITFREMMQRYTFSLDGTPCYKEVGCER